MTNLCMLLKQKSIQTENAIADCNCTDSFLLGKSGRSYVHRYLKILLKTPHLSDTACKLPHLPVYSSPMDFLNSLVDTLKHHS